MILDHNLVYILDDEPGVRQSIETILSADGFKVKSFARGADLIQHMDRKALSGPAAALVDLRLPDTNGVEVMVKIKAVSPETEVIMLTGNPDLTSAVDSVNAGAYAYILKPYHMDEIKNILKKIFEKQRLVQENLDLTEKLKSWNQKLEEEVHRRTLALNESYQKLQQLYAMRTQFVSIMSHELRTPATAVMGFADTLKDNWAHLSKEKIQHYLDIISTEAGRMVSLMAEIFEVSRIQEGKIEFKLEKCDIMIPVKEVIAEFRNRFSGVSIGFAEKNQNAFAEIDSQYFKIALSHVLMNAVKYTVPGRGIILLTDLRDGKFILRVEDEGPGIRPEIREKVFEPFFRMMDDTNRKTPGAGLGLTIAKGILNRMNANVCICDKVTGGNGCSVKIEVPVVGAPA